MKGLRIATLWIVIGLALLVHLMSATYVHADGIKTPQAALTPAGIGTLRIPKVPTRIHLAENTPAGANSPIPQADSHTPIAPTSDPSYPTPVVIASTAAPVDSPTAITIPNTALFTATNPAQQASPPAFSPTLTAFTTFVTEPDKVREPTPKQPTITAATTLTTQTPDGNLSPELEVPAKEPTLLELQQQISENTDVVVLNADGQSEPLVTQAAADMIAQGDPMWCPDGVPPGGVGCTSNYASMTQLLASAGTYINSQTVNGTIWITSGLQSTGAGPITIDGSTYTNWANYSLTLQGGWSGISGDTTPGTNSIFNVPIHILNWNSNVTINNITIQNASGSGLGVITNGRNVAINNSRFINSRENPTSPFPWGDGADIAPNGGNVTIRNSEFSGNNWDGLFIANSNNITIIDSSINLNGRTNGPGGGLNASGVNSTDIHNSEFTGNRNYDMYVYCHSGEVLIVSYPDAIPTFPTPVRMDIFVDQNCDSSAYLVLPTATPVTATPTITATATPTGPTPTATATPTGPTQTATGTATGSITPTSTFTVAPGSTAPITITIQPDTPRPMPTFTPRTISTIRPGGTLSGGGSSRPKSKGEFFLDCKLQESFTYSLPNGDKVEVVCPAAYWSGKVSISRLDNTTLPDELPAGYIYASAFLVNITKLREPVQLVGGEYLREEVTFVPEGGYIKASFVALGQEMYTILYWDAIEHRWIPLKDFLLDQKGRAQVFDLYPKDEENLLKIISGVRQVRNLLDPRVEVSTNFPGIFVLAQH